MDSTINTKRGALGRGAAAAVTAAALALGGIAFAAPANAAENDVVASSGYLDWGYKQTFRNYVSGGGVISVADGAERSGSGAADGFRFPVASGHVTDADTVTIDTAGKAQFTYTAHFFDVALSNISIVVDGDDASIVADTYVKADIQFGDFPQGTFNEQDVVLADIGDATITRDGGNVTVSGTNVVVTADGAKANPLYAAGTVLDDFTVTAAVEGAGETPVEPETPAGEGDITVTLPEAETPVEPETGTLNWEWASTSAASLGAAAEDGSGNFVASGSLNSILVTDSRKGGSGDFGWEVQAKVSDFASASGSFSASALSWEPRVKAYSGKAEDITAGPAVSGLDSARTLATARNTAIADLSADLTLTVPNSTAAGDYRATVTITTLG